VKIVPFIPRYLNNQLNRTGLVSLFLFTAFIHSRSYAAKPLRFFLEPTIGLQVDTVYAFKVKHAAGFANDTLYQAVSAQHIPVYYYRQVLTEVCQDGECRLLRVKLYWNITGRYLGFKLPGDEFLSKKDHEPFKEADYRQLNTFLGDSLSPLKDVSKADIASPVNFAKLKLDAVTSATSHDISNDVVAGAAFTTYTMWHLVYGPTAKDIMRITEKQFSPDLVTQVLSSQDIGDKLWVLDRLKGRTALIQLLWSRLLTFIDDENYTLAERTLRILEAQELRSPLIQERLVNKLFESDHSLKLLIVDKLKDAPELNMEVCNQLTGRLTAFQGDLLNDIFELYKEKHISDNRTCQMVAGFLNDKNKFISRRAYDFLASVGVNDKAIQKKMANYKSDRLL